MADKVKTAILILNWNGTADTISCIRSLFSELTDDDFVFIIDNGSAHVPLHEVTEELNKLGKYIVTGESADLPQLWTEKQHWYLLRNGKNLGFGGGNNKVLQHLLKIDRNFASAWLLNNDATVVPGALKALQTQLQSDANIAVTGSVILNAPDGKSIQCAGVKHYKWLGISKLVGKNSSLDSYDLKDVSFDYLNGASLMFKLSALELVGYFDERFFLYSEELDLQLRLVEKGKKLKLVDNSFVIHKLSGGTSSNRHLFYFYYNFSAVLLNRKHYGRFVVIVSCFNLFLIALLRTFPNLVNLKSAIKGIAGGLKAA